MHLQNVTTCIATKYVAHWLTSDGIKK